MPNTAVSHIGSRFNVVVCTDVVKDTPLTFAHDIIGEPTPQGKQAYLLHERCIYCTCQLCMHTDWHPMFLEVMDLYTNRDAYPFVHEVLDRFTRRESFLDMLTQPAIEILSILDFLDEYLACWHYVLLCMREIVITRASDMDVSTAKFQEAKYTLGMRKLYSRFHPRALHRQSLWMLRVCTVSVRRKTDVNRLLPYMLEHLEHVQKVAGTNAYLYAKLHGLWCEMTTLQLLSKCPPSEP
jgi:hypothetical protein